MLRQLIINHSNLMKKYLTRVLGAGLLTLAVCTGAFAQQAEMDSLMQRADSLYDHYHEKEALELYNRILERKPDNYTALWRASFLYSRIGNRFEKEEQKRDYFNRGITLAEQALQEDSTDVWSNFVMSVAMGRKALIAGARDRVAASRAIKQYARSALKYDSTNPGPWHVMGRWHFKIANLNFVERLAANTLFGGIPGPASNEEAIRHIQKAIELQPDYILYYYDLADIYRERGRDREAIETCRKALELPVLTPDDPGLKDKCREMIDDLR